MKGILLSASICGILIFVSNHALGFDDQTSHRVITERATKDISSLGNYLMTTLGFKDGVNTRFPSNSQDPKRSVIELLKKGSTEEDASSNCRASNHFHNPLKPWNSSAMSDEPLWLDAVCAGWKPWYSNIVWATGQQYPDGQVFNRNNQTMGWDNAREYFYSALTAASKTECETNFAKTFQAVGQVMHLLQDMAVPAHVRNDFESHLNIAC